MIATPGGALPSLPRQAKSSARPAGAGTGSPLTSTRVAMASPWAEPVPAPPSSSSEFPGVTVSGTTGPANGRTADLPSAGKGATGPVGSDTCSERLLM